MGNRRLLICFLLLCATLGLWAKGVTDTLESAKGDRVIVTYDITQRNGKVAIRFIDAKKRLGRTYRDKYKKLDEVAALFFDRVGTFDDDAAFTGITPEAFMIPSSLNYWKSSDGYFLLNDAPTLSLETNSARSHELRIPIFLAHHEGKRRYKVFSRCEDLVVQITSNPSPAASSGMGAQPADRPLTSQGASSEEEETMTDVDEANILISKISDLLDEQEEYPFMDELKQAISSLRDRSYRITDRKVSARISELLAACKSREDELKAKASAAAKAAEEEAERQARLAEQRAIARQDSIAAAAQLQAEKERKQNLWLIIGGAILAVLAFVGNLAFQHFRNVKNQKSMMEMQESVVRQAENEAKRRASNMAHSQVSEAKREIRNKTRSAINDSIGGLGGGKGKKGFSI